MGIEKKSYSFRLHEDVVAALHVHAAEENRSLSNMVETILLQYLRNHPSKTEE